MTFLKEATKMSFILTFDIPRENLTLEKRVNRMLKKIKARMLQFSVWSSENLEEMIKIALMIKKNGGSAKY
jgi:CRISPR-associated endonuclease Cas2